MALQGLPPVMFLSATYENVMLRLQRGDSIVFFSDGLSDTKNRTGDFFGTERIREVCSSMLRATPQEQLNAITTSVKAHAESETQQDDRTIAVLHYKPSWRTRNESRNSN
jgi:sigma-B regulation protein RsbU (phosphoserine phosphatase)